jgi:uncharacterized protein YjbI with pentapeptide repeats
MSDLRSFRDADCFVDGYNVNARLDGAKLTNANLNGTTLRSTNLYGTNLISRQGGVQANSSTIYSNGLNLGTAGNDYPF